MPTPLIDIPVLIVILQHVTDFFAIALIVLAVIWVTDKKLNATRPMGLLLLGVFLITGALYDLINFLDAEFYRMIFLDLPEWLVYTRYIFSIILRSFIISMTVGSLYLREPARRVLIAISIFTIVTIYWKHPYHVFENTAFLVEENFFGVPSSELRFPAFPWISMLLYVTVDLLIAGVTIWYLTLPNIKALFKK